MPRAARGNGMSNTRATRSTTANGRVSRANRATAAAEPTPASRTRTRTTTSQPTTRGRRGRATDGDRGRGRGTGATTSTRAAPTTSSTRRARSATRPANTSVVVLSDSDSDDEDFEIEDDPMDELDDLLDLVEGDSDNGEDVDDVDEDDEIDSDDEEDGRGRHNDSMGDFIVNDGVHIDLAAALGPHAAFLRHPRLIGNRNLLIDLFGDEEDEDDDELDEEDGEGEYTLNDTNAQILEFDLQEQRENEAATRREERTRVKEDEDERKDENAIRTDMFGDCPMCAVETVVNPVGCIYCNQFIGCKKCANRWYRSARVRGDAGAKPSCPMCREEWVGQPIVGDMLDLIKTE